MYLNPLGKPQAVISEETAQEAEGNEHARGTVRNGSTKSKDDGHSKEMKEMRSKAIVLASRKKFETELPASLLGLNWIVLCRRCSIRDATLTFRYRVNVAHSVRPRNTAHGLSHKPPAHDGQRWLPRHRTFAEPSVVLPALPGCCAAAPCRPPRRASRGTTCARLPRRRTWREEGRRGGAQGGSVLCGYWRASGPPSISSHFPITRAA